MENNLTIPGWEDDEYRAFKEKFRAKKTTDDCYTPGPVYEAVADWVAKEYAADKSRFVRPFFPGGDYEHFSYPEGCAVVDNPPFSILSRILTFYHGHGIPFFLFAPALTLFSAAAERWTLSDRELEIVKYIDARKTAGGGDVEQGTDLRKTAARAGDLGGGV